MFDFLKFKKNKNKKIKSLHLKTKGKEKKIFLKKEEEDFERYKKTFGKKVKVSKEVLETLKDLMLENIPEEQDVGKTVFQFLREKADQNKIPLNKQILLGLKTLGNIEKGVVLKQEDISEEVRIVYNTRIETKYLFYKTYLNNILEGQKEKEGLENRVKKAILISTIFTFFFIAFFMATGWFFKTYFIQDFLGYETQIDYSPYFFIMFFNKHYFNTIIITIAIIMLIIIVLKEIYKNKIFFKVFNIFEAFYLQNLLFYSLFKKIKLGSLKNNGKGNFEKDFLKPYDTLQFVYEGLNNAKDDYLFSDETYTSLIILNEQSKSGKYKQFPLDVKRYDDILKILNLFYQHQLKGNKFGFGEDIFNGVYYGYLNYSSAFLEKIKKKIESYNNVIDKIPTIILYTWFWVFNFFIVTDMSAIISTMTNNA